MQPTDINKHTPRLPLHPTCPYTPPLSPHTHIKDRTVPAQLRRVGPLLFRPFDATEGPLGGTEGPLDATEGPLGGTEGPLDATEGPLGGTEGPLDATEGPLGSTEGPLATKDNVQHAAPPIPPVVESNDGGQPTTAIPSSSSNDVHSSPPLSSLPPSSPPLSSLPPSSPPLSSLPPSSSPPLPPSSSPPACTANTSPSVSLHHAWPVHPAAARVWPSNSVAGPAADVMVAAAAAMLTAASHDVVVFDPHPHGGTPTPIPTAATATAAPTAVPASYNALQPTASLQGVRVHSSQESSPEETCFVCFENVAACVFLPCGHGGCCRYWWCVCVGGCLLLYTGVLMCCVDV